MSSASGPLSALLSLLNGLSTDMCWLEGKVGGALRRDPLLQFCLSKSSVVDGVATHAPTHTAEEVLEQVVLTAAMMALMGGVLWVVRFFRETLKDIPPPPRVVRQLVPPRKEHFDLTVVLDLDETLVSFGDEAYTKQGVAGVRCRPQLKEFLQFLKGQESVEVIIWTAATRGYSKCVADALQLLVPDVAHHRVYRTSHWYDEEDHVKDLRLLRRDLSRVVMVENRAGSGRLQAKNTILVPDFTHGRGRKAVARADDPSLSMVQKVISGLIKTKQAVPDYLPHHGVVSAIAGDTVCLFPLTVYQRRSLSFSP